MRVVSAQPVTHLCARLQPESANTHTHRKNGERETHTCTGRETREESRKNKDASFTHESKRLHQCADINSFNTHSHQRATPWLKTTCDLGSLQAFD